MTSYSNTLLVFESKEEKIRKLTWSWQAQLQTFLGYCVGILFGISVVVEMPLIIKGIILVMGILAGLFSELLLRGLLRKAMEASDAK
jgi:hypothetical protein